MPQDLIKVTLILQSSFCNAWPELEISANGEKVWKDFVKETQKITVEFPGKFSNSLRVSYLNKRQGPDVWDTVVDGDGKILEDQHCILKSILINGAKCDWLVETTPYQYPDQSSKLNFGFMDGVGHMEFYFPDDVYQWILDYRKSISPVNARTSSLDYKNIYIPKNENDASLKIINEVKEILEKFND